MELMNISHGSFNVQAFFEYVAELRSFRFAEDIKLGDWTISKMIGVGGPKLSHYKYDWHNYLEFFITDKNGESRVWQFYYNIPCEEITEAKTYHDNIAQRGVRRFLENHPIFDSENWSEYESLKKLAKIKKVLNSEELSSSCKLEEIRNILQ